MKVFNVIIGIFSIFAAVYCIWFPGVFFLNTGWFVTMLLGAWGVCALFEAIAKHTAKDKGGAWNVLSAVLAILAGIAAAVICILTMVRPGISLLLDVAIIIVFVTWLILDGIGSIVTSLTVGRKAGGKKWIWTLILGILVLLGGIYGIFHMIAIAQTIGLLLGVLLMLYGVRLIASVAE